MTRIAATAEPLRITPETATALAPAELSNLLALSDDLMRVFVGGRPVYRYNAHSAVETPGFAAGAAR